MDFLLTPQRDNAAAEAFLCKALRAQGLPEKITIDQSGSNTAAITRYNKTHKSAIVIRHSKYLNNIVEQDRKGQMVTMGNVRQTPVEQFYSFCIIHTE